MSEKNYFDILMSPVVTEKSSMLSESNKVVFKVSLKSSKQEIKKSIEALFKVNVKSVNTLRRKGKTTNFKNSFFDKTVSIFCVSSLEDNIVQINFLNPIFFETNKSILSQAQFKIIDTDTNKEPKFLVGSPTYIHAMTRPLKSYHHVKNVYLDSSCPVSKEMFKSNSNMSFRIKLAETFLLEGGWSICLKKLIIPASMNNIYEDYCTINLRQNNNLYTNDIHIQGGYYPTITHLLEQIQHQADINSIPIQLNLSNGKVILTHNSLKGELTLSASLTLSGS